MDQEAERDVQPVRLADTASRSPGGADHRQHHGPAGEDHDQQSGEQTGEGGDAVLRLQEAETSDLQQTLLGGLVSSSAKFNPTID